MKKQLICTIITLLCLLHSSARAEEDASRKVLLGTITRIDSIDGFVSIRTDTGEIPPFDEVFTFAGEQKIIFYNVEQHGEVVICRVDGEYINLLHTGLDVYMILSHDAVATDTDNQNDTDIKKEDYESGRDYGRRRINPHLSAGLLYKTENVWRGADFYGKESGATLAYVNLSVEDLFIQAMYEHPGFIITGSDPENYNAFNLSASYSLRGVLPLSPYLRIDYKYMPWADEVNTSSFMTATAGIFMPLSSYTRLGLNYSRDWYTDSLDGDRQTLSDYLVRFSISSYIDSFILANTHMSLNLYAEYFNNKFNDSKTTSEDESRKGISDVTGQVVLNIEITAEVSAFGEWSLSWLPDSDWNREGKTKNWFGFGVYMKF